MCSTATPASHESDLTLLNTTYYTRKTLLNIKDVMTYLNRQRYQQNGAPTRPTPQRDRPTPTGGTISVQFDFSTPEAKKSRNSTKNIEHEPKKHVIFTCHSRIFANFVATFKKYKYSCEFHTRDTHKPKLQTHNIY